MTIGSPIDHFRKCKMVQRSPENLRDVRRQQRSKNTKGAPPGKVEGQRHATTDGSAARGMLATDPQAAREAVAQRKPSAWLEQPRQRAGRPAPNLAKRSLERIGILIVYYFFLSSSRISRSSRMSSGVGAGAAASAAFFSASSFLSASATFFWAPVTIFTIQKMTNARSRN